MQRFFPLPSIDISAFSENPVHTRFMRTAFDYILLWDKYSQYDRNYPSKYRQHVEFENLV